ncbi:MAG: tyrosine-type recombinase/integrase, partial [Firmicutes bacterium]|nr:tyrosine-type recombinase/integrase [Bacillota bacterium]
MERLITHIYSKNSATAMRDRAVFELMFATGMRVSELCSLSTGDVSIDSQLVRIIGKGNKERLIHISNPYVLDALKNYFEICDEWKQK